uniref:Putative ovule protein n=1 Tax=Solanum chacoense TaxID=4108 RepID=A0A0V0IC98_SOLCH
MCYFEVCGCACRDFSEKLYSKNLRFFFQVLTFEDIGFEDPRTCYTKLIIVFAKIFGKNIIIHTRDVRFWIV